TAPHRTDNNRYHSVAASRPVMRMPWRLARHTRPGSHRQRDRGAATGPDTPAAIVLAETAPATGSPGQATRPLPWGSQSWFQYFSGTNRLLRNGASSSYSCSVARDGTATSCRGTLSYGIRLRRWAIQFRRARRLLSERMMYHGAWAVSVTSSMRSRARE